MPRPTTKSELIAATNDQFNKLWKLIDTMPDAQQRAEFPFEDRDRNLRDVLMHLVEWHRMMASWHQIGTVEGGMPDVPGKDYTWKTLPALNLELWKRVQDVPLDEAKALLKESHAMILSLALTHSERELFERGVYKWTKSTTLGAYFISSTASHYEWAMKKIKRYIKESKEAM